MVKKVIIKSNIEPMSLNHIYKATCIKGRTRMYLVPKARKYKEEFFYTAKPQTYGHFFTGDVKVTAICTFGTKRKKDISNCLKLELDALNQLLWKDDSQVVELVIHKRYEKNNPGLILEIEEIPCTAPTK